MLDAPEKTDNIDNTDVLLYFKNNRKKYPGSEILILVAQTGANDGISFKVRPLNRINLNSLWPALNKRFPAGSFGGRAAAGRGRGLLKAQLPDAVDAVCRWLLDIV